MSRILIYTETQTMNLKASTMLIDDGVLYVCNNEDLVAFVRESDVKMAHKTEPKDKG